MSALSSNDQITELHKMYKMDHCYCTSEIIVYIYMSQKIFQLPNKKGITNIKRPSGTYNLF